QHARQREIGPQLLLRDAIALALQPLRIEADVPGLELAPGEGLELLELLHRRRPRRARQLLEKLHDFRHGVRHAGGEGVLRIVAETENARRLVTLAQDLLHDRRVIPLAKWD